MSHCDFFSLAVICDGSQEPLKSLVALDSFALDEIRRGLELLTQQTIGGSTDQKRRDLFAQFNKAMGDAETAMRQRFPRNVIGSVMPSAV